MLHDGANYICFLFSTVTFCFYFSAIVELFLSTFVLINEYECMNECHAHTNTQPSAEPLSQSTVDGRASIVI